MVRTRQITFEPRNHLLTHAHVWSPDGQWLVFDVRSDAAGAEFDSPTIEIVHVHSGEQRVVYRARHQAHVGVASFHPLRNRVAFIQGPEYPTPDWSYAAAHRQGVMVDIDTGMASPIDARDLTQQTPGALSGGSHVHIWHPDGSRLSFTYEDAINPMGRTIGISLMGQPVTVPPSPHPSRNHAGSAYSFIAVPLLRAASHPTSPSDKPLPSLLRACEEAWVGSSHLLAFQGTFARENGEPLTEVFLVDACAAPDPSALALRRLSFSEENPYPGIQGPRHWLKSKPDGTAIGYLAKDAQGVVQFWTVSPTSGACRQVTQLQNNVSSAFTWSPCGQWVALAVNTRLSCIEVGSGKVFDLAQAPVLPWCVCFSPDGGRIAWLARVPHANGRSYNQIFITEFRP